MKYPKLGRSEYTLHKQRDLRYILSVHIGIIKRIWAKRDLRNPGPPYVYFDMLAGPGLYDVEMRDGSVVEVHGSPLIFLQLANALDLDFRAHFVERNNVNFSALTEVVDREYDYDVYIKNVNCIKGDFKQVFQERFLGQSDKRYGLMYFDFNGSPAAEGSDKLIRQVSTLRDYKMVDFLIYFAANPIRRSRKVHDTKSLKEILSPIAKDYWIIREPDHPHMEFTFLLGSNWDGLPDFKALGFHRLESPKGKEVLRQLNYTKEEKQQQVQPPLMSNLPT